MAGPLLRIKAKRLVDRPCEKAKPNRKTGAAMQTWKKEGSCFLSLFSSLSCSLCLCVRMRRVVAPVSLVACLGDKSSLHRDVVLVATRRPRLVAARLATKDCT